MTATAGDCVICDLEQMLKEWTGALRRSLQKLDPTDPNYEWQFEELVAADTELRTLRGQNRSRRKP